MNPTTRAVRAAGLVPRGMSGRAKRQPALPQRQCRTFRAFIQTQIVSTANRREHWAVRQRRGSAQHGAICAAIGNDIIGKGQPRRVLFVLLTMQPLDDDNLRSALKSARDSIARLCGFDDSADVWRYQQRKREHYEPGGCFVKVTF